MAPEIEAAGRRILESKLLPRVLCSPTPQELIKHVEVDWVRVRGLQGSERDGQRFACGASGSP